MLWLDKGLNNSQCAFVLPMLWLEVIKLEPIDRSWERDLSWTRMQEEASLMVINFLMVNGKQLS